jgi:hypothetical protein
MRVVATRPSHCDLILYALKKKAWNVKHVTLRRLQIMGSAVFGFSADVCYACATILIESDGKMNTHYYSAASPKWNCDNTADILAPFYSPRVTVLWKIPTWAPTFRRHFFNLE